MGVHAWGLHFIFLFLKILIVNSFSSISLEDFLVYIFLKKVVQCFCCEPKTSMNLEMQQKVQNHGALKLES